MLYTDTRHFPAALFWCWLAITGLLATSPAFASFFFVNSADDSVDAVPGDAICADASANCTLRAAIMEANALPGADTIILRADTYTLAIPGNSEHAAASGDLDILDSVTIQGVDPASTIIDGAGIDRIFEIILAGNVSISQLTVQNGLAGSNTPGYFVDFAGGGISNVGNSSTVILKDVDIRDNAAQTGGGVFNVFSTLQIHNSTVHNNSATAGSGGGVAESLASRLSIYNTTISGNQATGSGGGLITANLATVLNNVTLFNNVADSDNDGTGNGGGLAQGITGPSMGNTILAENFDTGGEADDCAGGISSRGYNLIGTDGGCTISVNIGDQIGTMASPLDPVLAPLGDNGGATPTHALLNGSPALDNGNPALPGSGGNACETSDQRSTDRAANAPCDIGAFEHAPTQGVNFTVNSTLDQVDASIGDGACETVPGNNICTLRAAIQETNALIGADQVTLPAGNYVLAIPGVNENAAAAGDLDITDGLDIAGEDSTTTLVDGNRLDRLFHTRGGTGLSLSGVTISNGLAGGAGGNGGGIFNEAGNLSLSDCVVSDNEAASGGGIFSIAFNSMTIDNCLVRDNVASLHGGGIANFTFSTASINNTTISGNSAQLGGGLMNSFLSNATLENSTISNNQAQTGGGIGTTFTSSTVTLINTTVSGNSASVNGGGISISSGDTINLRNVTITANQATGVASGGGISSGGTVNFRNSIIAANSDAGGLSPDCSGTLTSQGYNLVGNNNGCTLAAAIGDTFGSSAAPIDPLLGPLSDNGGLTLTHALLGTGSPALNKGNTAVPGSGGTACEAEDQRGTLRTVNAPCDIGAVESPIADLGITLTDSADPSLPGDTLVYTIEITNTGPDNATGLVMTDALPAGVNFIGATGSGWACTQSSGVVSCNLSSLMANSTSRITLSVQAPSVSELFSNSASVSSAMIDDNTTNNTATETTGVNARPVLTTSASRSFRTSGSSTAIAPDLTISDVDDTHLESAVVQFTSGFDETIDKLVSTNSSGISTTWIPSTGTLTLSGHETLSAYQIVLRSIRYTRIGDAPYAGSRTFSYQANDGDADSTPATSFLSIEITTQDDTVGNSPAPASEVGEESTGLTSDNGLPSTDIELTRLDEPGEAGPEETVPDTNVPENTPVETTMSDVATDTNKSTTKNGPRPSIQSANGTTDTGRYRATSKALRRNVNADDTATESDNRPSPAGDGLDSAVQAEAVDAKNLWQQLDAMKHQMDNTITTETERDKVVVGTAKGFTLVLFAGVMNWYLKAGSLMASLLSSVPLWTPFDPLPILSVSRKERERRRNREKALRKQEDREFRNVGHILDETPGSTESKGKEQAQ